METKLAQGCQLHMAICQASLILMAFLWNDEVNGRWANQPRKDRDFILAKIVHYVILERMRWITAPVGCRHKNSCS